MYILVGFQFRCKCYLDLLGLALGNGSGNPNKSAKVTGMTNQKCKLVVG